MNLVRIETDPPRMGGPMRYEAKAEEVITPPPGAYFITQTLKPAYNALTARRQIKETKNIFKTLLKRYSDNLQYVLELTKASNIHYHGWFVLRNDDGISLLQLIDDLKILGNVKIDKIKGNSECIRNYLHKDTIKTDRMLNYTAKGKPKEPKIKLFTRYEDQSQRPIAIYKEINTKTLDFDEDLF